MVDARVDAGADQSSDLIGDMRSRLNDAKEAEQAARLKAVPDDALGWVSVLALAFAVAVGVFVATSPQEAGRPGFILIAGAAVFFLVVAFAVVAQGTGAPIGALFRLRSKKADVGAASGLGVTGRILDSEPDPIALARRDGVVVYANRAYMALARALACETATGAPPRLDRLFSGDGEESVKLFHLYRAARSGRAADAVVERARLDGPARRFSVAVRAVDGSGEHVVWRVMELKHDEEAAGVTRAGEEFASVPTPVLALSVDRAIVNANPSARALLGEAMGAAGAAFADVLKPDGWSLADLEADAQSAEAAAWRPARIKVAGKLVDLEVAAFRSLTPASEGHVCVAVREAHDEAGVEIKKSSGGGLDGFVAEAPFGVAVVEGDPSTDGKIASMNRAFQDAFPNAETGTQLVELFSLDALDALGRIARQRGRAAKTTLTPIEAKVNADGERAFQLFAVPAKRRRGSWGARTILYAVDVTEQKQMEVQYALGQKLQAVGKLAGGVAHDFNNLLTVIIGNTDMLMSRHSAGDPSYPDLVQIQQNANRAANLVRKLLAFSRKQTLQPEVFSVTDILQDFKPFLTRTLTEKVSLNLVNGRDLPDALIDKGQFEVVIMNLAVNARDAMTASSGGELTIRTRAVPRAKLSEFDYPLIAAGDYVLVEVADNGEGVPAGIQEKIFEPFFTTKGEGKGNGLGLSTVYGIIKQFGGYIFLDSEPGAGACFRIFLPAAKGKAKDAAAAAPVAPEIPADLTGSGRILVVEDEDSVRSFIVRALGTRGYEVEEAEDGEEGLEIIEAAKGGFDLVLSDVMMPGLDGPAMIAEAKPHLGGAKVVFMSGYAEATIADNLARAENTDYLQKPFTLKVLAAKVKDALAAK